MKEIYGTHVAQLHRTAFFTKAKDAETIAAQQRQCFAGEGRVEVVPVYDTLDDFAAPVAAGTRATALAKLTPEERAALGHPDPEPEPVAGDAPAGDTATAAVAGEAKAAGSKAARKVTDAADQAAAQV